MAGTSRDGLGMLWRWRVVDFMRETPGTTYRFGALELAPSKQRHTVGGEDRALEPKSYRLLAFLVENRGHVVTKDEILQAVWSETTVTDNALTRAVAQIRKALDDDPKDARYIETVPTVGYRFVGELLPSDAEPAAAIPETRDRARRGWIWIAAGVAAAAGIVILGFGLFAARRDTVRDAAPAGTQAIVTPTPLTTYRGNEESPSFSPDGNQVAFAWDGEKGDNSDIYVKALGQDSTPIRLTTDPARDLWPEWSPDGRTIAFVRIRAPNRAELMLIPALGGAERKLTEFQVRLSNGFMPQWSADSRWLVAPMFSGESVSLFRVSVENGDASPITQPGGTINDTYPSMSPDGRTLLFVRKPKFNWGTLYALSMGEDAKPAGQAHRITTGNEVVSWSIWTPDGKDILASTQTGVLRFPAAGSANPQRVSWLGPSAKVNAFAISRRGNRLAYAQVRGDANIWRIDLRAKPPKPEPFIASTARDVFPQYSPDGTRIAFYSDRGGSAQIWVADADGQRARQVTFVPRGQAATPHWSRDGKTLAIDSNSSGVSEVYTISPEGGRMRQLTEGPSLSFGGMWSRDARWMYVTSNRSGRDEVWKMPDGGGAAVQVTRNGGLLGVESEDGKTLYFGKDYGAGSIWKMPVAGGPEEQLTNSLYRLNFALAKQGIYYMSNAQDDGTAELRFYSFAARTSSTILAVGRPEFGLALSPDERYLIYAQLDDAASDLMLVENFH